MPYVTSIERIGRRRGRKEGRKEGQAEGLQKAIQAVLRSRFGRKGVQLLSHAELPSGWTALGRLHEQLLDAEGLDQAAALIEKAAARTGSKNR